MTAGHSHDPHSHPHREAVDGALLDEPRFEPGLRVRLVGVNTEKYKRHPEYAEGAIGEIERIHGAYRSPTATDETAGEYLYSVRFRPRELWGEGHPERNGSVYTDVWEDALEEI